MRTTERPPALDYDTITTLAFQLCLEKGCEPGDAERFWKEAELWLRYRDADSAELEARLEAAPKRADVTPIRTSRPEEPELLPAMIAARFGFREASFALPVLRSNQLAALTRWRPREDRPQRSGKRRWHFRTPIGTGF